MLFFDSLYIVSNDISYSYSYAIIVLEVTCIIAVILVPFRWLYRLFRLL